MRWPSRRRSSGNRGTGIDSGSDSGWWLMGAVAVKSCVSFIIRRSFLIALLLPELFVRTLSRLASLFFSFFLSTQLK